MLCKTAADLRQDWYDVCWTVNLEDTRLDVLNYGSPAAVRQVREQIVFEIAISNARPEVKAARSAYYQHITECEECRTD